VRRNERSRLTTGLLGRRLVAVVEPDRAQVPAHALRARHLRVGAERLAAPSSEIQGGPPRACASQHAFASQHVGPSDTTSRIPIETWDL
jgi:hypothetical protein